MGLFMPDRTTLVQQLLTQYELRVANEDVDWIKVSEGVVNVIGDSLSEETNKANKLML
eukprot:SAG31_NODE_6472_length_2004_cov_1.939633_2_plen_58_part_00